ncbi:unnamed protein product [Cuscuta epithymum]|uniref:SWIM-type domain-containing protein n=1 Tax=Cuscuta epithymum TaxID=186058 RepID=A0AAV0EBB4_9ASTE|nr:unnamed protein product [Cuscuta epithymum]CAH9139503.1 unnamed protein product [Cuscuta epithymum]
MIQDNSALLFYLHLKKQDTDVTKFPLCITTAGVQEETNCNMFLVGNKQVETTSGIQEGTLSEESSTISEEIDINAFILAWANKTTDELLQDKFVESEATKCNNSDVAPEVGLIYKNRAEFKKALKLNAIKNHFQYMTEKSNKICFVAKCLDENCSWEIKAKQIGTMGRFKVVKLVNTHSCRLEVRLADQRHATSSLVAECIQSKLLDPKAQYNATDVKRDMLQEYGVEISYLKAWRAKEKALNKLRGKPEESYGFLPRFLNIVKQTNPGSFVQLKINEDNTFLYVFMAIEASIKGWEFCRPVIVVDGTFLTGRYGGTLLTASTQDACGKIFPIAFSVVDSENDESWKWFFRNIKEALVYRSGMVIVSDRHESIAKAVLEVYPESGHGVCIYHLFNNLKTKFKRKTKKMKDSFFEAAQAYTKDDFDWHIEELKKLDEGIVPYLYSVGYEKWTRVFSTSKRYSTMTSNIAESLNAALKKIKNLPITALLQFLHALVQIWTHMNRNIARNTFTKLAKVPHETLEQNYLKCMKLKVIPSSEAIFTVSEMNTSFIVNLEEKNCTCRRFQVDELPCIHALAVLKKMNQEPYKFCSSYYLKDTMQQTYQRTVHPIPDQGTWPMNTCDQMKIYPPHGRKKSGRPKKQRYKAHWESTSTHKCGKCGNQGHNRKTCRNAPQQ